MEGLQKEFERRQAIKQAQRDAELAAERARLVAAASKIDMDQCTAHYRAFFVEHGSFDVPFHDNPCRTPAFDTEVCEVQRATIQRLHPQWRVQCYDYEPYNGPLQERIYVELRPEPLFK